MYKVACWGRVRNVFISWGITVGVASLGFFTGCATANGAAKDGRRICAYIERCTEAAIREPEQGVTR